MTINARNGTGCEGTLRTSQLLVYAGLGRVATLSSMHDTVLREKTQSYSNRIADDNESSISHRVPQHFLSVSFEGAGFGL